VSALQYSAALLTVLSGLIYKLSFVVVGVEVGFPSGWKQSERRRRRNVEGRRWKAKANKEIEECTS
jgi:hypothetical protein